MIINVDPSAELTALGESDEFLLSVAGQVREHLAAVMEPIVDRLPDDAKFDVAKTLTVEQIRPLVNTLAAAMNTAIGGPDLGTRLMSEDKTTIAVRVNERGQREWKLMDLSNGTVSYNAELVLPGSWAAPQ